jgi:hypothetical protein
MWCGGFVLRRGCNFYVANSGEKDRISQMKSSVFLFGLLGLALVGCKANPSSIIYVQPVVDQNESPLVQPPAKFGWKEFHAETFETYPVHSKAYKKTFKITRGATKMRVAIQADSAVFGGAIPDSRLTEIELRRQVLRAEAFAKMPCSLQSVDKIDVSCELDRSVRTDFIVRDARAEGTEATGAFGAWHHSSKLVEHATLPNKIQISLSSWQCIENCTSGAGK